MKRAHEKSLVLRPLILVVLVKFVMSHWHNNKRTERLINPTFCRVLYLKCSDIHREMFCASFYGLIGTKGIASCKAKRKKPNRGVVLFVNWPA